MCVGVSMPHCYQVGNGKASGNLPEWLWQGGPPARHTHRMAHFLIEWREYRKLTQAEASRLAGWAPPVLNRLEKGERKLHADHLKTLAGVYRCEEWELIGRDPKAGADVVDIWSRIPAARREQARRTLESFTENKA